VGGEAPSLEEFRIAGMVGGVSERCAVVYGGGNWELES